MTRRNTSIRAMNLHPKEQQLDAIHPYIKYNHKDYKHIISVRFFLAEEWQWSNGDIKQRLFGWVGGEGEHCKG